jgi:polar amino acid transport system substrate-binding protein
LLAQFMVSIGEYNLPIPPRMKRALSTLAVALILHFVVNASASSEETGNDVALYSEAQAARGRDLYGEHCASCHGMKLEGRNSISLSGATFQARWADGRHSVGDLFYIVRTLMPFGQPGSLSRQEYLDIIAFLLMMNGYPAGAQALPMDSAVLDKIIIRRP